MSFYSDIVKNKFNDLSNFEKFELLQKMQHLNNIVMNFFEKVKNDGVELGRVFKEDYNLKCGNNKITQLFFENIEKYSEDIKGNKVIIFEQITEFNKFTEDEIPKKENLEKYDEISFDILKKITQIIENAKNDDKYEKEIKHNIKLFLEANNIEFDYNNYNYIFTFFKFLTQEYYGDEIYFVSRFDEEDLKSPYLDRFIDEFLQNGILDNFIVEIDSMKALLDNLDKLDNFNIFLDSLIGYKIECDLFNHISYDNLNDFYNKYSEKLNQMLDKMNANPQFYRVFFKNDYFYDIGFEEFLNDLTTKEKEELICSLDKKDLILDCKKFEGLFVNYYEEKGETDFCLIQ